MIKRYKENVRKLENIYFIQTTVVDIPDDDGKQTLMMGFLHKFLGTGRN